MTLTLDTASALEGKPPRWKVSLMNMERSMDEKIVYIFAPNQNKAVIKCLERYPDGQPWKIVNVCLG